MRRKEGNEEVQEEKSTEEGKKKAENVELEMVAEDEETFTATVEFTRNKEVELPSRGSTAGPPTRGEEGIMALQRNTEILLTQEQRDPAHDRREKRTDCKASPVSIRDELRWRKVKTARAREEYQTRDGTEGRKGEWKCLVGMKAELDWLVTVAFPPFALGSTPISLSHSLTLLWCLSVYSLYIMMTHWVNALILSLSIPPVTRGLSFGWWRMKEWKVP